MKILKGLAGLFLVLTLPITIYLMTTAFFAYNGPFYRYEFKKNHVYDRVPEANRISNQLLTYYNYFDRSYNLPNIPEFSHSEKTHATDVKMALHKGQDLLYSLIGIQALLMFLILRNRKTIDLVLASSGLAGIAITGVTFILMPKYFDTWFDKLHEFLFKPGTWYFYPGQPFIEMFHFHFFIAIGKGIVSLSLTISFLLLIVGMVDYWIQKNRAASGNARLAHAIQI